MTQYNGCLRTVWEEGMFMQNWIGWLIAGISIAGLLALWFAAARRELSQAKRSVEHAIRQVELHVDGCMQAGNGPYKAAAIHSLGISRSIYREAIKNYETVRHKPVNRLPAFLLGYGDIPEKDEL